MGRRKREKKGEEERRREKKREGEGNREKKREKERTRGGKKRERKETREREKRGENRENNVQGQLLSICIQFAKRKNYVYWQKCSKSEKVAGRTSSSTLSL